jgi:predicted ferric reductase
VDPHRVAVVSPETWWYVARSGGLVAWALLTASTCIGLAQASRLLRGAAKAPWILDLHRYLAMLTVVFTGVHLVGLWADSFVTFGPLELLVPMMSGWRPGAVAWGIVALYTLIAVQVTSLLMSRLPRRLWHTVHLSSLGLFVMATVHGVQAGSDLSNTLITWIGATATTLLVFAAVYRVLARSGRRRVPA